MKHLRVILLLNCLLALVASGQGYAQSRNDRDELNDFIQRNRGGNEVRVQSDLLSSPSNEQTSISRGEASDRARSAYSGRVLSIRLEGRRWRVRMDEEGTVFNVFVDSENGEVTRPSE